MIPSTSSRFRKSVPKAKAGDRVAVLSPAFAAPGMAPEVHEQAMRRLQEATGLIPADHAAAKRLLLRDASMPASHTMPPVLTRHSQAEGPR